MAAKEAKIIVVIKNFSSEEKILSTHDEEVLVFYIDWDTYVWDNSTCPICKNEEWNDTWDDKRNQFGKCPNCGTREEIEQNIKDDPRWLIKKWQEIKNDKGQFWNSGCPPINEESYEKQKRRKAYADC